MDGSMDPHWQWSAAVRKSTDACMHKWGGALKWVGGARAGQSGHRPGHAPPIDGLIAVVVIEQTAAAAC